MREKGKEELCAYLCDFAEKEKGVGQLIVWEDIDAKTTLHGYC